MKPFFTTNLKLPVLVVCMVAILASGCKKAPIVEYTTEDVNITGFLDKYPDNFSEFRKILDITDSDGFLQAYGAYTFFLPTNDAVKTYLQANNKTSVEEVDATVWKDIVRLHLIQGDTIKTTQFTDGKLGRPTMFGQYLVTGPDPINPTTSFVVNRQANIIQSNISVGNGVIHVIDNVLIPAKKTLAEMIASEPKFEVFAKALEITGLYDSLNFSPLNNPNPEQRFLTVFAETDMALEEADLGSIEELVGRYSVVGANHKDTLDGLNRWVAYHISPSARYFADLISTTSIPTLVYQEGLSTSAESSSSIKLNVDPSIPDPGYPISFVEGDVTAFNGVIHTVNKHFNIIKRVPRPTYLDVTAQPEFVNHPSYDKANFVWDVPTNGALKEFEFQKFVTYIKAAESKVTHRNDYLEFPMGGSSFNKRLVFTTPVLVAGTYRVWIGYPSGSNGNVFLVYFNDQLLPKRWDPSVLGSTQDMTEEQRYIAGWKRYMGPSNSDVTKSIARLLGTAVVFATGRHTVTFELVDNSSANFDRRLNLDLIQFIPVTPDWQDQLWPRFWTNGRVQERGQSDADMLKP
ncbi:fasciclin domain-containing protein [Pedobacter sp. P351]|uniref:fasciclin domain-containing protein n=1 Tax=Pedobacter superstes TaxID=3133441 RepID=UPI0030B42F78